MPFLSHHLLLQIKERETKQQEMRLIGGTGISRLVFLVLFTSCLHQARASSMGHGAAEEMVPVVEAEAAGRMMVVDESRRKLGSFQICSLCTCCGGENKSYCLATPCCYAINCNIPNRPFGFCSFTPKTCNCFGCHL